MLSVERFSLNFNYEQMQKITFLITLSPQA